MSACANRTCFTAVFVEHLPALHGLAPARPTPHEYAALANGIVFARSKHIVFCQHMCGKLALRCLNMRAAG